MHRHVVCDVTVLLVWLSNGLRIDMYQYVTVCNHEIRREKTLVTCTTASIETTHERQRVRIPEALKQPPS